MTVAASTVEPKEKGIFTPKYSRKNEPDGAFHSENIEEEIARHRGRQHQGQGQKTVEDHFQALAL